MLSWGIASVVIFCVSVSLLNKLLPHNVPPCQRVLLFRPLESPLISLCQDQKLMTAPQESQYVSVVFTFCILDFILARRWQ